MGNKQLKVYIFMVLVLSICFSAVELTKKAINDPFSAIVLFLVFVLSVVFTCIHIGKNFTHPLRWSLLAFYISYNSSILFTTVIQGQKLTLNLLVPFLSYGILNYGNGFLFGFYLGIPIALFAILFVTGIGIGLKDPEQFSIKA